MNSAFFHETIRFFTFFQENAKPGILRNQRRHDFTILGLNFSIYEMLRLDTVTIDSLQNKGCKDPCFYIGKFHAQSPLFLIWGLGVKIAPN